MRLLAFLIAVAVAAPARADVVRPRFDELEAGATAVETYRLNALGIASEGVSPAWPTLFGGGSGWWRPVRGPYRGAMPYEAFFRTSPSPQLGPFPP